MITFATTESAITCNRPFAKQINLKYDNTNENSKTSLFYLTQGGYDA